jgi:hypothetical protein
MDGCDAMKSDPISKDQLADGLSALLGAATLNLDPTISVDLGMAQRLVDILRHSASGEPSEEQVRAFQDATRHALPIALVRTALQAAGIQSRQADAGAELRLGCLLATIHGDGGQYRQIHGTAKAVSDATRIVDAMRATTVSPTDDAIRSAVKLNSTPDRHCTVFKGTEITGYTLTDEGIAELRKLFGGVPVAVTVDDMMLWPWGEMCRAAYLRAAESSRNAADQLHPAFRAIIEAAMLECPALSLRGVPEGWKLVNNGEPVSLVECPIGLFECAGEICVKTEYTTDDGRIEAYIASSGEFFCGEQPQTKASQHAQIVQPMLAATQPGVTP